MIDDCGDVALITYSYESYYQSQHAGAVLNARLPRSPDVRLAAVEKFTQPHSAWRGPYKGIVPHTHKQQVLAPS